MSCFRRRLLTQDAFKKPSFLIEWDSESKRLPEENGDFIYVKDKYNGSINLGGRQWINESLYHKMNYNDIYCTYLLERDNFNEAEFEILLDKYVYGSSQGWTPSHGNIISICLLNQNKCFICNLKTMGMYFYQTTGRDSNSHFIQPIPLTLSSDENLKLIVHFSETKSTIILNDEKICDIQPINTEEIDFSQGQIFKAPVNSISVGMACSTFINKIIYKEW